MRRRPDEGLLVHRDRGVQYASNDFRKMLNKKGFVQSISRKGDFWDNAMAESLFHAIKTQLIYHTRLKDKEEAEQELLP